MSSTVTTLANGSPASVIDSSQPTTTSDQSWPPLSPGESPKFTENDAGAVYTNTTIDDFSPLVAFSDASSDWVSPLTDSAFSAVRSLQQRIWNLGTYRRTELRNATVGIEFWGSEIHLYGDTGPMYGTYSLKLDDGEPTIHSAFSPNRGTGRAHLMSSLTDLSEGRHNLTITVLGTREDLAEGLSFLFDYAEVRQRVAETGGVNGLQTTELRGDSLTRLNTNGTWLLQQVQDDIQPGEGGLKPAIYISRNGLATTEKWATLTHTFRGSAIHVYGGRNATHGSYLASLTDVKSSRMFHSQVYNASVACDFPEPEAVNVKPGCEWRGSVLKYAAADLNPDTEYELKLQNLEQSAFEVSVIRIIGPSGIHPTVTTSGNGTSPPTSGNQSEGTGSASMASSNPFLHMVVLIILARAMLVCFRH